MTDERMPENRDEPVSRAYRELATETTPPAVDEAILRRAREAANPAYVKLRAWTRPLAWAATIGLSLVIVMQLAQVAPRSGSGGIEVAADSEGTKSARTPDQPASVNVVPRDADIIRDAENLARLQAGEQLRPETGAVSRASSQSLAESQHCDDDARASAQRWLECIDALAKEGRSEHAEAERDAFRKAHPDHRPLR
jgi:hypothetical protein